ncbi:MAG: cell division protein [Proteobacteria bacterium]|nr:MAG: cell division protein [Pseudomonadota bacterium]
MSSDTVSNQSQKVAPNRNFSVWRYSFVITFMGFAVVLLTYRLVQLHVIEKDFLINQGEARAIRFEDILANRGIISDRNGEPLAVSTPVETVWMNPGEMLLGQAGFEDVGRLCQLLSISRQWFEKKLERNAAREFVYLKRKVDPALARKVKALKLPGIHIQRDYKRFYPAAEVAAHVVGFVNIDERGQEGIELAYDDWLNGVSGKKKVLKDRLGNVIKDLALIRESRPGGDIQLALDMRLQFIAYRELKAVVRAHRAKAGSVVVLDANTAEVLAMVNQPSYNPNNRLSLSVDSLRNRAVTDVFEPGSTVKPITILAALETGKYATWSKIDTSSGLLRIGRKRIRDHRDYGVIDVATVVAKSSNVGTSKIALDISGEKVWDMFYRLGLGQASGTGFPGERMGKLPHPVKWKPLQVATLSYGYGLNVTALQLAQAYQVIANDGLRKPASLLVNDDEVRGEQVVDKEFAAQVRAILQKVVEKGGTGTRAQVPAYKVGGKTGTVHSVGKSGYQDSQYISLFAGIAPADTPEIVMSIVIDGPQGDEYYGGEVAAPVFSRIANSAMRLLNVSPASVTDADKIEEKLEALLSSEKTKKPGGRNG